MAARSFLYFEMRFSQKSRELLCPSCAGDAQEDKRGDGGFLRRSQKAPVPPKAKKIYSIGSLSSGAAKAVLGLM